MESCSVPCSVCGTTPAQVCGRCKTTSYCSSECQKSDWKTHKEGCKLKTWACCDLCQNSAHYAFSGRICCFACGQLLCSSCGEEYIEYNCNGTFVRQRRPCPGCGGKKSFDGEKPKNRKTLKKLLRDKSVDDGRRSRWICHLAVECLADGSSAAFSKAKAYLNESGELGCGEAYFLLGEIYTRTHDWVMGKDYYEKAAKLQNVMAMACLSTRARYGHFVFGDERDEAAKHGSGSCCSPDQQEAFRLTMECALLGYPKAQANLGALYLKGLGCTRNLKKAVKWFRKAADSGDPLGMTHLGFCYKKGDGVDRDNNQAQCLFRKAADLGNTRGMIALGFCYKNGDGVDRDDNQARYWFSKAADSGDEIGEDFLEDFSPDESLFLET